MIYSQHEIPIGYFIQLELDYMHMVYFKQQIKHKFVSTLGNIKAQFIIKAKRHEYSFRHSRKTA